MAVQIKNWEKSVNTQESKIVDLPTTVLLHVEYLLVNSNKQLWALQC